MPYIAVQPVMEALFIILLVLLSGGYTAAETAILTILRTNRAKKPDKPDLLPEWEETVREELPQTIERLARKPGRLTGTIMLGRLVTRVITVAGSALLSYRWAMSARAESPLLWVITGLVIVLLLMLVLGELLPRIIGTRNPHVALTWTIPLVGLSALIFLPITSTQTKLLLRFARSDDYEPAFLTLEELNRHLQVREEAGALEVEEREMIEEILEFGTTMVREVMVPRIDIKAISADETYDVIREIVSETGHSRLPVIDGDIDHVIGIMHVKDMLRQPAGVEASPRELARKALFMPETKMIDDLLREFQQAQRHMAIVVDEYGGTSGMVTLEDLIEEIVGEIQDEYDSEAPLVLEAQPGVWVADAIVNLDEFAEFTGITLPEDGWDTLGGFLYSLEGNVPESGEVLAWEDLLFTIMETEGRRILKVKISRK
ncbi:hemolysin family protein [Candidatus Zixiibacteriota bacterium]